MDQDKKYEIDEKFQAGMKKYFGVDIQTKKQEENWTALLWWANLIAGTLILQLLFG